MGDYKRRSLTSASWIPLRAYDDSKKRGRYGYLGYLSDYFAAVAILLPGEESKKALSLEWADVCLTSHFGPYLEDNKYFPAGTYRSHRSNLLGTFPVLSQSFDSGEPRTWHLNQDIVLGLGLHREKDVWVRPEEDYIEVARILGPADGNPLRFEIRTDHMRDFLRAAGCGLLVATYRCREAIVESAPDFGWEHGVATEAGEHYRWEGRIYAIHEGGMPYGEKTAVLHVGRTNIDPEEDLPGYGLPGEDEYESKSWEQGDKGRKLYRVSGEMWRNEWIEPASHSPRVRGDDLESQVRFMVDNSGAVLAGTGLQHHRGWLWFKPSVVISLLKKRKGCLEWYTENTGEIGPAPHCTVHFGVNDLRLINVLAGDIALLPEIYQKVWVAHNCPPDGGVSRELLESQMEAKPADTVAPEALLGRALTRLQKASAHFLGRSILKEHQEAERIQRRIHRFQGDSMEGIRFLCKELTRLISERIDVRLLQEQDPAADKKLRPIKRLDHFLTSKGFDGRRITASLVGANELRIGDAHLPSEEICDSLSLLGVRQTGDYQQMAKEAIHSVAVSVQATTAVIIKTGRDA